MSPAGNRPLCRCQPGLPDALCRRSSRAALGSVRLGLGGMPQPFGGEGGEGWVEFDAGELASEGEGGQAGGAGAAERVEHHAARLAAGRDAARAECRWGTRRSAGPGRGGWGSTRRRRGCGRSGARRSAVPYGARRPPPACVGRTSVRLPPRDRRAGCLAAVSWLPPGDGVPGGRACRCGRRVQGGPLAGWWRAGRGWGRGRTSRTAA